MKIDKRGTSRQSDELKVRITVLAAGVLVVAALLPLISWSSLLPGKGERLLFNGLILGLEAAVCLTVGLMRGRAQQRVRDRWQAASLAIAIRREAGLPEPMPRPQQTPAPILPLATALRLLAV